MRKFIRMVRGRKKEERRKKEVRDRRGVGERSER
jgi:hypothetical protein